MTSVTSDGPQTPQSPIQRANSSQQSYILELERQLAAYRGTSGNQTTHHNRDAFSIRQSQSSGEIERVCAERFINGEIAKEWKLEVKRWKRVTNRYGSSDLYEESEKIEDIRRREHEIKSGGYVLIVYDEYDSEGNKTHVFLGINSTPLLDLLRQVISFYPGDEFDVLRGKDSTDESVSFPDPCMIFFAYRKQLQQSLRQEFSEEAKKHLKLLLDFMKTEHPITSAKLTEIEEGRCKKIQFDKLWLLYPPNTSVYACKGTEIRQMVIYSKSASTWTSRGPSSTMKLCCWEVTYEQGVFKRDFKEWSIEPYSGEKNIANLELVPAQYMPSERALHNKLVARGQRYFELNKGASLQDYHGDRFPRVYTDEPVRVVVDEDTYWRKHPSSESTNESPAQDYGFPEGEEELLDHEGKPLDDTLLRCFPEVGVFSLRDKEWALVKVDDLKPVQFREKAFKRLVIKDEYKKIIRAMVQAYMLEKPGFSDIVSGKGRGLAILLHGPPGTGKTLTAECVAEVQKCPLFTISCGDLGTEPDQLEVKIKEVFQYAVTWKAILLLDEADIFLQERDMHDVKRNALVSIFLRELEYFDGILFLTTNRPGDIDEAFVSRIHISVELKALDQEEQKRVWAAFIKELDLSDAERRALLKHTENFEGDRLNGRQIRNAIRTALALAQLYREHVNSGHLDTVLRNGREYVGYVERLNRMNPEEYATAVGRRASAQDPGRQ